VEHDLRPARWASHHLHLSPRNRPTSSENLHSLIGGFLGADPRGQVPSWKMLFAHKLSFLLGQ